MELRRSKQPGGVLNKRHTPDIATYMTAASGFARQKNCATGLKASFC